MAALKKVNLSGQIFGEQNVLNKPPIPSRPSSGKFLNRGSGKLFPSAFQNKELTNNARQETPANADSADHMAIVLHPCSQVENDTSEPNTPKSVPNYCRRTQSAKARVVKKDSRSKTTRTRPLSAGNAYKPRYDNNDSRSEEKLVSVVDLNNKVIPDLFEIEREKLLALPDPRYFIKDAFPETTPMHFTRPSQTSHVHDGNDVCYCKKGNLSKRKQKRLQPSVYGLLRQRQVYGSAPDLTSANTNFDQFPYKFSANEEESQSGKEAENVNTKRSIPQTLYPLLPWLCDDVPQDVIGVNPAGCLIFLPSADWSELPEVPEPVTEEEDLPFVKDITTPRPWNPKKYSHPFYNKKPVEEWVCNHRSNTPDVRGGDWQTIYRPTLRVPRMRTADVIRKEISDLENLLKGVGTQDTNCSMVKYQSEISDFQELLRVTLDMVPERLKNPPVPPDTFVQLIDEHRRYVFSRSNHRRHLKTVQEEFRLLVTGNLNTSCTVFHSFGLNKFCDEHDIILANIRTRVNECRQELAELEVEAGIESARQHFRKRSNSVV